MDREALDLTTHETKHRDYDLSEARRQRLDALGVLVGIALAYSSEYMCPAPFERDLMLDEWDAVADLLDAFADIRHDFELNHALDIQAMTGDGSALEPFTLKLKAKILPLIVQALTGQFTDMGGKNYVEATFEIPDAKSSLVLGPFIVTVQKATGKTPATLKAEADAARDQVIAALKASIANHCASDKIFCSTCSPARALIARIEHEKEKETAGSTRAALEP